MKKLAFFFIVLISLMVIAGCNNSRKSVTRFGPGENGTTTTITKVGEEETDPTPMEINGTNVMEDKMEDNIKLAVTSLDKKVVESNKSYHLIRGSTPKNTSRIIVNDYTLRKYATSETQWSYIASVSLGTLKKGENNYTVRAIDSGGNEIASETFTIVYNGNATAMLANTGNSLNLSLLITLISIFGFYSIRRLRRLS